MSTRAIASATGMGKSTVDRELSAVPNGTPESEPAPVTGTDGKTYTPRPTPQPPRTEPSAQVGPNEEIPTTSIIGTADLAELNAQTPTPEPEAKAEPQKPRRTPITDEVWDAILGIKKALTKLAETAGDDRFAKNKTQIAELVSNDLGLIIKSIAEYRDNLK